MTEKKAIYLLHITIPVLLALFFAIIIADLTSSQEFTGKIVTSIDQNREDVLKLASSSTAVSVAITALPGDLATPVAEAMSKLGMGFLIVLCALYLEEFLLPVMGLIAFRFLVPIACLVYIAGFLLKKKAIQSFSYRIACFSLALFLVIPIGAGISELVRDTYGETISQTIESANNCADQIEDSLGDNGADEDAGNGLGAILKNLQQTGDTIARGTSQFMQYLEKLMNHFLEACAIMIVTSCLIPILVIIGFIFICKLIFKAGSDNQTALADIHTIKEILIKEETNEKTNS